MKLYEFIWSDYRTGLLSTLVEYTIDDKDTNEEEDDVLFTQPVPAGAENIIFKFKK